LKGAIKECARVLKAGGKMVFSIPHPVFHLSKRIEEPEYHRIIKKYKKERVKDHPIYEGIKHYHRPIEYYMEQLFENGFLISDFHEVTVKHTHQEKATGKLLEHKQEIPTFLVVGAKLFSKSL